MRILVIASQRQPVDKVLEAHQVRLIVVFVPLVMIIVREIARRFIVVHGVLMLAAVLFIPRGDKPDEWMTND